MQRPHSGVSLLARAANATAVQPAHMEMGVIVKILFVCISLCSEPSKLSRWALCLSMSVEFPLESLTASEHGSEHETKDVFRLSVFLKMSFAESKNVDTKQVTLGFMVLISGGQSEFLPGLKRLHWRWFKISHVRWTSQIWLDRTCPQCATIPLTLRKNVH